MKFLDIRPARHILWTCWIARVYLSVFFHLTLGSNPWLTFPQWASFERRAVQRGAERAAGQERTADLFEEPAFTSQSCFHLTLGSNPFVNMFLSGRLLSAAPPSAGPSEQPARRVQRIWW